MLFFTVVIFWSSILALPLLRSKLCNDQRFYLFFTGRLAEQKMRKWIKRSAHVTVLCLSWRVLLIHLKVFPHKPMQVPNLTPPPQQLAASCPKRGALNRDYPKRTILFQSLSFLRGHLNFRGGAFPVFFHTLEGFFFSTQKNPHQKTPFGLDDYVL